MRKTKNERENKTLMWSKQVWILAARRGRADAFVREAKMRLSLCSIRMWHCEKDGSQLKKTPDL